jgi:hypothetical protein
MDCAAAVTGMSLIVYGSCTFVLNVPVIKDLFFSRNVSLKLSQEGSVYLAHHSFPVKSDSSSSQRTLI